MIELPPGWELVQLGDVIQASNLKAEPGKFPSAKFVGLEHIESGTNRLLGVANTQNIKSTKAVFQAGDVLYGKLRPYLRKVCRPHFDGVCSTDILVFPATETLDNDYLRHFLARQETADYASRHAKGINIPRVSAQDLGRIDFPLPPLAEQRRIAARVNSLERRIFRTRDILGETKPLLEHFRQSVFAAAFRGALSAEWRDSNARAKSGADLLREIRNERRQAVSARGELSAPGRLADLEAREDESEEIDYAALPEVPDGWCWVAAEEVVEPGAEIVYGILQPGEHESDGVPYVRIKDIEGGSIGISDLRRTSRAIAHAYERSSLKGGDVLLGIIRATKVAIVPDELTGGNIGRAIARFRPSSIIRRRFLAHWLGSPFAQAWFHHGYQGIDMPVVNLSYVRRLPVPLAPLAEQKVIEERLDAVSAAIVPMGEEISKAFVRCDELYQAILSKAFQGKLVPQNSHDNPAADLLRKIAERHEAAAIAKMAARAQKVSKMMSRENADDLRGRLLEWIASKRNLEFTFEDVRQGVPAEYENLKEAIFRLLDEDEGNLRQVFNKALGVMQFRSKEQ